MASTIWLHVFLAATGLAAVASAEEGVFPLLMPHVKPASAEEYLCTPIRVDVDTDYYVTGFRPNATQHTAHHMLVYGCEEPGAEDPLWNCGEMAAPEPGLESRQPCKTKPQIIYAWGKDAPNLELPEGVAFRYVVDWKLL